MSPASSAPAAAPREGPLDRTIRGLKGLCMFVLFALFGLFMLLELALVLPWVALLNAVRGHRPERMIEVNRRLFALWTGALGLFGLLRNVHYRGQPPEGACVMVANHPGLFDVLFLIRHTPRLSVMVKSALVRRLPLGPIFRASGYVVGPEPGRISVLSSLVQAIGVLRRGYPFLLFPEGGRSPVGELRAFKAGAFKMARKAGVPVQPVLLRNVPPFLPRGEPWYLPPRATSLLEIEFWEPLPPPQEGQEREAARALEARYRDALGLGPGSTSGEDGVGERRDPGGAERSQ